MRQILPVFSTVGLVVLLAACGLTSDPVDLGSAAPTDRATVVAKHAFRIQDLGTLGGDYAYGEAINARTQVVGGAGIVDGLAHTFLWTPGRGMQDLGTLGGENSDASSLNERGDVAGSSQTGIASDDHAFLWVAGHGMRDLGTLGGTISFASGVNNRRQVVGYAFTEAGRNLPFLWKPGRGMRSLGGLSAPEDEADALDINDATEVVGQIVLGGFANPTGSKAFLWTPQGGMQDLGNLGSLSAAAIKINARGDVTGRSDDAAGVRQAFLWRPHRGMEGLGTLGGSFSLGHSLNVHRVVVGISTDAGDQRFLPFVWTRSLGMQALPTAELGADGGEAEGINDRNEISGKVFMPDGNERAVLWRPRVDLLTASIDQTPGELFGVAAVGPPQSASINRCLHRGPFGERELHTRIATASRACPMR